MQRKRELGADLRGLLRERRSHGRIVGSLHDLADGHGIAAVAQRRQERGSRFPVGERDVAVARHDRRIETGAPIVGHDRGGAQHELTPDRRGHEICDLRGVQDERHLIGEPAQSVAQVAAIARVAAVHEPLDADRTG